MGTRISGKAGGTGAGNSLHKHEYAILKDDGLGWRCVCGHLREVLPPPTAWDAVMDDAKPDHEHEYDFLDKDGWHCRVCGAIRGKDL